MRLCEELLSANAAAGFAIECAGRLSQGLARLATGEVDVAVLDLGLPDSQGVETFLKVYAAAPQVPVVVFTALADEAAAGETLQRGAQDYLIKGRDGAALPRAIVTRSSGTAGRMRWRGTGSCCAA